MKPRPEPLLERKRNRVDEEEESVTGIRRSRGEMEVRKIPAEFGGGFEKETFFVSKHKGHYCGPIKAQHVAVNVRK